MAGGKQTPRQKLIGMMYLMLTAMLAINVSKDVLNSFANIDQGIMAAVWNTQDKTLDLLKRFESQNQILPDRVGPFFQRATKVNQMADDICDYILLCKKEIVTLTDGSRSAAIKEDKVTVIDIKSKDAKSQPAQVMVVAGRGKELQEKIEEFREYCLQEASSNEALVASIQSALNTGKIRHADQEYTWVAGNFEHLPLAAVIAILSGIENSVRNVEADMINYKYNQIDEGSVSFNKIDAMLIPNTNYVIKGSDYRAKIFFAAYDTTTAPVIYIGDYKEIKDDAGNVIDYEMTRIEDSVVAHGGIGEYVKPATSPGQREYKGLLVLQTPTQKIKRPFEHAYNVAESQAVVSPTKMNVFYLGVENPVDISVPGVDPTKVKATINNGSIRPVRGGYVVSPARPGQARITISAEFDGQQKAMGSKEFRVYVVPDPVPKVANRVGGDIPKAQLEAQSFVMADIPDFLFDLKFDVVGFDLYTVNQAGFVQEAKSRNNRITDDQKAIIRGLGRNQRVYFDNIKVRKPGNIIVDLPSLTFRVQ